MAKTRKPKPFRDVAAVLGKDERGLHIIRRRSEDGPIEAGIVQPLQEGKPISGEVISMKRRPDLPFLFDVKTEVASHASSEAPEAEPATDGPAQVATESYRRGWDAIWGGRSRSNHLN
ncbi:MAG TPA: hypothetical protein VHG72_05165 [Polyangia bacterium]|nr:hypothetical protein [Polyangia bacterium]